MPGVDEQLVVALVNLGVPPPERVNGSLGAQRLEVRAAVPHAPRRELLQQQRRRGFLPRARVDLENFESRGGVGQGKREFPVETTRPAQRAVDGVHPVRRAEHHDATARVQSVHERQERGDDGVVDLVRLGRAHGSQAVDLVEEDDRGLPLLRLGEEEPELTLGLADPLGQDVRALSHVERDLGARAGARRRERASQKGLTRAGGSVKQHAAGRIHLEPRKHLGVQQRQEDHLLQRVDVMGQTANLLERERGVHGQRRDLRIRRLLLPAGPARLHRAAAAAAGGGGTRGYTSGARPPPNTPPKSAGKFPGLPACPASASESSVSSIHRLPPPPPRRPVESSGDSR